MKKTALLLAVSIALILGLNVPAMGSDKLSKSAVNSTTGIKWNDVRIDKEQNIVRELFKGHPLSPKLAHPQEATGEEVNQLKTLSTTEGDKTLIDKQRAQAIALEFLVGNSAILGFSSPHDVNAMRMLSDKNAVKSTADTNFGVAIPSSTEGYVVINVVEHPYLGKQAYLGRDYSIDLQQRYKGIPVFEGKCRILMDQFGEIYKVKNSSQSSITAPTVPVITADKAVSIAMSKLNSPNKPAAEPELVVYGTEHLAWHMNFNAPTFKEVLVDAITGEVLLSRSNVVTSCNVGLTVRDADNAALQYVTCSYWVPFLGIDFSNWTHMTNLNGNCSDFASTAGSNVFCRATLDSERVEVKDYDNGDVTVFRDTARFNTVNNQSYSQNIALSGTVTYDLSEGSVCFREINRAWDYLNSNFPYSCPKVTAHVDYTTHTDKSTGTDMYYWEGDSSLPNGIPSNQTDIADTILHEYGHCVQWHAYGNEWGIPARFKWVNHGWIMQTGGYECSFDAVVEGWAEFFPVMIYNHINPNDTGFGASDGKYNVNLENNAGYAGNGWNSSMEERNEFAFAEVLWDIYDNTPNEKGDTLALGEGPIWAVMHLDNPATVEEFFQDFVARYPEHAEGLESIYKLHGMHPDCMNLQTDFDNSETHVLYFGKNNTTRTMKITAKDWYGLNVTSGPFANGLSWDIDTSTFPSWLKVSVDSGNLRINDEVSITVTLDLQKLPSGYQSTVIVVNPGYGRKQSVLVDLGTGLAIRNGIAWLRSNQAGDGSWDEDPGITGLCCLAFLNAGYKESDPTVASAVQFILSQRNPDGSFGWYGNYDTSIAILALVATHNSSYLDEIRSARDYLLSIQCTENYGINPSWSSYGGWGYPEGYGYDWADLSNTQFTLMALDAAYAALGESKTGSNWIPKVINWIEHCQQYSSVNPHLLGANDGGFIYQPTWIWGGGANGSYGSMTYAGIWSYRLCNLGPSDYRVNAALNWVKANYSVKTNVGAGSGDWALYYYYMSMAKALTMTGVTRIVDSGGNSHDWFNELSQELFNRQANDGSWVNATNGDEGEDSPSLVTAYSLLALETRTLPPGAQLYMSIVLASHADLHVYDQQGRHMGVNYATHTIEQNIPGATYKIINADGNEVPYDGNTPDDGLRQVINLPILAADSYRIELVGTSNGPFNLTVNGIQDGNSVTSNTYDGQITMGESLATTVTSTALEGALTLLYGPLTVLPTLEVTPPQIETTVELNTVKQVTFKVSEMGGQETLHSVNIYCTDITGIGGTITGSQVTFDKSNFDVAPGGEETVTASIPIPAVFEGSCTGSIIVESLDGGAKSISVVLKAIGPLTKDVNVTMGLVSFDRRTGQFSVDVNVKNTSTTEIGEPVWLVINSISNPGVTLASPDGKTADGKPYINLSGLLGDGKLSPGETISKRIYFNNPKRLNFTFTPSVRGVVEEAPTLPG